MCCNCVILVVVVISCTCDLQCVLVFVIVLFLDGRCVVVTDNITGGRCTFCSCDGCVLVCGGWDSSMC